MLNTFIHDEDGAVFVEYGLLIALITCVVLAAVTTLGQTINSVFLHVGSALSAAVASVST